MAQTRQINNIHKQMQPLRNNTNIMATSLTVETTTKARTNSIPPPPGMTSSSSGSQSDSPIKTQHMLNNNNAFRNPPPGMSSPSAAINAGAGMIRRRAASTDDAGSHRLFLQSTTTHAASGTQQPTINLNSHSYTDNISPWNNIAGSSSNGGGIFRTSSTGYGGERALSSSLNRLRSDRLDPMLSDVQLSPNTNNNDDDSSSIHDEQRYLKNNGTSSAHTDGGGGSSNSTNDIFRSRGYSPIIGTPTRASGGRKPMWSLTSRASHDLGDLSSNNDNNNLGMGDNDNNKLGGGGRGDNEMDWISSNGFPMIRPSLSCPTSVFESPLFPRSSSSSSSVSGGGVQGLGIQHSHTMSTIMNNGPGLQYIGGGSRKNNSHQQLLESRGSLLSQPYRLEKIMSASQEIASPENDEGGERMSANFDDDEESVPANLDDDDVDGLGNVDVSVIECDDDEESPFRSSTKDPLESVQKQQQQPQTIMSSSQHHHPTSHSMVNRPVLAGSSATTDVGGYPMRKLSDAFEMLVVNGDQQLHHATNSQQLQQLSGSIPQSRSNDVSKSGVGESSAIKPSPTSVSGFESEPSVTNSCSNTTATISAAASNNNASAAVSTHQLENGLTVASISMQHFHLHSSLRGTLCQGLIDRVSFYSVLRDINKEALDAAMTDPKGVVYNDGTVHEKNSKKKGKKKKKSQQQQPGKQGQQGGQNSDENSDSVVGDSSEGKQHVVVAKDDKVHLHPNPKEEVNSVLVMACVSEDHNPNEPMSADGAASSMSSSQHGVTTIGKPPSLGAALLDEEWWLMSAIASRTPEEVAMNQSTKLLPTFFEAMGEKDGTGSVAESTGAYSTGASSRTQLWKPGRSWWEAKSGKNPWVEPVVHNNRWR